MQNDRPRKQQRISQACKLAQKPHRIGHGSDMLIFLGDLCHRRSIRCRPSNEDTERCQNCYDFDVACTFDRPSKRRKHPQAPSVPRDTAIAAPQPSATSCSSTASVSVSASASNSSTRRTPQSGQGGLPDYVERASVSPANARVDLVNRSQTEKHAGHSTSILLTARETRGLDVSWKAFALARENTIFELLDIYVLIVYPL